MRMHRVLRAMPESLLFLFLGLFVLAACGSNTPSASVPGSSATATACAQATRPASSARSAVGTLKSISGQTLVLTTQRGSNATVTYTSTTRFTQEAVVAATALQEGTPVRVTVTSGGGTYTATSIVVTTGTTTGTNSGFPRGNGTPGAGFGGGNNPCFARGRFGRGTPGAGTPGAGANNFRGLVGTVSQLSGNIMTITDTAGTDYTVTITTQTQIVETKNATAADLKVGQALTVTGTAGGQGAISARLIAILLSLPKRTATPTATQ